MSGGPPTDVEANREWIQKRERDQKRGPLRDLVVARAVACAHAKSGEGMRLALAALLEATTAYEDA